MINPKEIKALIEAKLPGTEAQVESPDNVHFEARVVSEAFRGLSSIKRHQLVYQALGDKMHSEIHALSLKTLYPGE